MKPVLVVVLSALLPAAALGQVGYLFDQGPTKGPEGAAISVPAGGLISPNYVADLVTFTAGVFPKKLTVYSQTQPGNLNFEVRRYDGSQTPREIVGQGAFLVPMTDLGPVPGSATGLRAWEKEFASVDGTIPAGTY